MEEDELAQIFGNAVGGHPLYADESGVRPIRPKAWSILETRPGGGGGGGGGLGDLFTGKVHLPPLPKAMTGNPTVPLQHNSRVTGLSLLNPSTRGPLGPGVYASDHSGVSNRYGPYAYDFEVPTGDILHGISHSRTSGYLPNRNPSDLWRQQGERIAQVSGDRGDDVRRIFDKNWMADGYHTFGDLSRTLGSDLLAQSAMRRAGFRGISGIVDGPEYLMFDQVPVRQRGE